MMFHDAEFVARHKDAVVGSRRLKNAILRSLGHKLPPRPRQHKKPVAPVFRGPTCRRGRPPLTNNPRLEAEKVRRIQWCVARSCKVRVELIRSAKRRPRVATARHLAMFVARKTIGISYPQLGLHFGRDHTTIIYGVEKIQALIDAGHNSTIKALQRVHERLNT